VQPRAAQLLLEMLPTTVIGRSRLVERQVLADFPRSHLQKADDPSGELNFIRAQGAEVSRKKLRTLVRRDLETLQLDSLHAKIEFIPGRMIVSFRTIEDLAQAMCSLARVVETDGDKLARRYEVHEVEDDGSPNRSEFETMLQELYNLEANRAAIVLLPSSVQRFCNGVVIGQLVSISVADEPIVLGLHHPHRQMTCRLRRYCSASSSGRSCLCNYRSSLATHKPMRRRSRIHLSEINGRSFSGLRRTSTGQSSPLIARQRRPDHL